ncbi:hypothetical protein ACOMHN_030956 [Nucella lapillus]
MNYTSTMQFIELFRQHRALWDRHDINYLNKAERMRLREQIGFTIGMTEVDVGKKICNLRTYYLREMVKRDKALEYGQDTAETYVPKWPYFDALDTFLQDVVRKKRNEYLTAGGFQDLPFMYSVDDHLSEDNDVTEDLPTDGNDASRDGHTGVEGGGVGGRRSFYITTNNDTNACSNDSDNDLPAKRPKLEPEEDYTATGRPDQGEDGNPGEKEPGSQTPESCPGSGAPVHRSPSLRSLSSILPTTPSSMGGGGLLANPSLHRLAMGGRGPPCYSAQGFPPSSPNLGLEGPRLNGHGVGGGTMVGTTPGHHAGGTHRVPQGMTVVEEDEDWLFGRYIAAELKKVKSFKDKQLTKMRIQQIVTYAQLGMAEPASTAAAASSSASASAADVRLTASDV